MKVLLRTHAGKVRGLETGGARGEESLECSEGVGEGRFSETAWHVSGGGLKGSAEGRLGG